MSEYAALVTRINASLTDVEKSVLRVKELSEKANSTGDDGYWDGVALNLHGFYTGIEKIFEDIARTIEGSLPSGTEWHKDLLTQMAGGAEGIRPAVINHETRHCLDMYRGFRHLVRNVYTFNLRPTRIHELANDLPDCFQAILQDLNAFMQFLISLE
ncbi:MAG: hypothetical protein AB1345_08690 [Chloroflexota bacterium]